MPKDNKSNNLASRNKSQKGKNDKAIPSGIYPVINTDIARDNLENDIPDADLQDLERG